MSVKKSSTQPKTRDNRVRNFATVVYPESAPEDWQEILSQQFVPCFISPLHDKDLNPTGEPKKPHYHVIVMYEGKKSLDQAKDLFDMFGGVGCEVIQSIRGYARYLCHLDNPEKAQYLPDQVRSLCGADYSATIGLVTDKYKAIDEIMDFCDEMGIYSYRDLMQYCRKERRDWFRVLCDNGSYVVLEYLKSASWSDKDIKVNTETGEIID